MAVSTQIKQQQSIFPDFPRGSPTINKDGNFTDNWHLALSSLFQALQRNYTNEGIQIPQLISDDINTIESIYNPRLIGQPLGTTPNISGKIVYDTTNSLLKVFIITFTDPDDPSSDVVTASWKTFTIT